LGGDVVVVDNVDGGVVEEFAVCPIVSPSWAYTTTTTIIIILHIIVVVPEIARRASSETWLLRRRLFVIGIIVVIIITVVVFNTLFCNEYEKTPPQKNWRSLLKPCRKCGR
jgi:hypothetical protein